MVQSRVSCDGQEPLLAERRLRLWYRELVLYRVPMMRMMGVVSRMTVMGGVPMAGNLVRPIRRERGGCQQENHGYQKDLVHCV